MTTDNKAHGAASWIQHSCDDPAKAETFYKSVLDWNIVGMPMQDGSTYNGIMLGEEPIGGFCPTPSATGSWLIYITVDDVDQRYQAALDAGAKSIAEPFTAPGVGRMATICDPFGANLALISYQ